MNDLSAIDGRNARHVAFDLAVAAGFAAVTIAIAAPEQRPVAALLAVALATRALALPVMIATGLAAGLPQLRLGDVHLVADLAYAALFFTLGAQPRAGVRWFGLGGAIATVGVVAVATRTGDLTISGNVAENATAAAGYGALTAVVAVGGWLGGYLRHQSLAAVQREVDEQLRLQAAEAERHRLRQLYDLEQERVRIAADMHDVVGHSWAVVAAQADGARYTLDDPARAEAALAVIGDTARTAMTDLGTILARLRHETNGDTSAPGRAHLDALFTRMRASGMTVDVTTHGPAPRSALIALTAQRIIGEALTNALKYGDLRHPVTVVQDYRDGVELEVRNRRRHRSVAGGDGTGHGLVGMSERAVLAGGRVTAGPEGDDWVVRCSIARLDAAPSAPDGAPDAAAPTRRHIDIGEVAS